MSEKSRRVSEERSFIMRSFPVLVLAALLLCAPIPVVAQTPPELASPTVASGDFTGLVDIGGGRRLWAECRGEGSPTVILEGGAGNDADSWDTVGLPPDSAQTAVLPGVARFTRVCAYDRPGTTGDDPDHRSRSDPAPMPRDARAMVADLHALLTAAAIPGPYVLAGHSFGGLVVRLFAATYPDEVAGLVLIDAAHEDYYDAVRSVLTADQWAGFTQSLADPEVERIDVDASAAEMREAAAASPLHPLPLVVLTHGRPWDWPTGYPVAALEAVWMPLQEQLAALTPDARLIVAAQSGHFIPGDQPESIIAAIQQVVDAVRDPQTGPEASATATVTNGQANPAASVSGPQLTPLLDRVLAPPHWFTGSDGQVHLVYELLLTNALPAPVTVDAIDVRDADSGATLTHLSGESLLAAMSLATSPETPSVVLPPSSVGVVWLDIPLASAAAIPESITHRLSIEPPPDLPVPAHWLTYTSAPVLVDQRPPVVLGPPLTGAGWAALGSCCDGPHRRALYPIDGQWYLAQRFAIDFNQLDAQNRPGVGDPSLPTSFPTFGQPVLAVAAATVVEAVDRYPDLKVGQAREDVTPESAGGNRVILDLGDGRFAIYAHLHAGSVAVHPGDRVTRGQQIAKAGSSGTTGGPHLHFQVTDRPSVIVGDGLPYVFAAFTLTGQTPPLADVIPYYDTLESIPITPERTGPRHDELPLGRDVVTFGAGSPGG
jgi:pimeloyl-ACP methyl ester carboxylesterase